MKKKQIVVTKTTLLLITVNLKIEFLKVYFVYIAIQCQHKHFNKIEH